MSQSIFHLAFPVDDLRAAKEFYVGKLGCALGRMSDTSMILDFHGNQLVAHLTSKDSLRSQNGIYPQHYGLVFSDRSDWESFLESCRTQRLSFYQEPQCRHLGEVAEHLTFFLKDPTGNLLEFKYYLHQEAIFSAQDYARVGDAN